MTPADASVPYSVVAADPLMISMRSMSFGIDRVERRLGGVGPADAAVVRGRHVRQRLAAHAHPVDVDDGIVAHRDARVAPQTDRGSDPQFTSGGAEVEARGRALQQVHHLDRPVGQLRDVDLRDRVADLAPARCTGRAGDHDLVETESELLEHEVGGHGLTGTDGHLLLGRAEADALGAHQVCARRNVDDEVASVGTGESAERLVRKVDLRLRDRATRAGLRYDPGNAAVFLRLERRREKERQHARGQ